MKLFHRRHHKPTIIKPTVKGTGNVIVYNPADSKHLNITVIGNNNKITIKKMSAISPSTLTMYIYGDDCVINIDKDLYVGTGLEIYLGQNHPFHGKIHNTKCYIGKNTRIEQATIVTYNSNNTISIGDNCLISLKVYFYNTDGHPIYSLEGNTLLNYVSDMIIGNHCWIGYDVTLLKNVHLPDNTIVGWGSVVTRSIDKSNCAIAGNPATIIKENLRWDFGADMAYIDNKR